MTITELAASFNVWNLNEVFLKCTSLFSYDCQLQMSVYELEQSLVSASKNSFSARVDVSAFSSSLLMKFYKSF
jgi:hypothetical protein